MNWLIALTQTPSISALPIPRSNIGSVDAGPDAWADTLVGVGPLILLIGERNTKQLLRDVHGLHNIFSLAFAPLGLLSVLTSMIRLCGSHTLRGYLGYEHEARANAAIEMTKANCGGIHAELVDGFIVRRTSTDPASQVLAVAMIDGTTETAVSESLEQIKACDKFQKDKEEKGCPPGLVDVKWCFRLTCPLSGPDAAERILDIVANALLMSSSSQLVQLKMAVAAKSPPSEQSTSGAEKAKTTNGTKDTSDTEKPAKPTVHIPTPLKATFVCTFEGVSELSTSPPTTKTPSIIISAASLLSLLALYIICLWQEGWFAVGWLLVVVGYIGVVAGVTGAAYMIFSACDSARLATRKRTAEANWSHGLVLAVKNTDSLDTTGSKFCTSCAPYMSFEAVWLRISSRARFFWSWVIAVFLSLSFICHYLGLRSSSWWLSVTELLVCLLAALARSMNKSEQHKFDPVKDVYLDKRCFSTGILSMQRSLRIDKAKCTQSSLDLRIYSMTQTKCLPLTGEYVAFHAAKLALDKPSLVSKILKATGLQLAILPIPRSSLRNVAIAFRGGVVTQEGLAYPNARLCTAFRSNVVDLAAPTALLARAVMRQPEWGLDIAGYKGKSLPSLGGTYIPTLDMLVTWWTIAEDRNEIGDQHKNLHSSFILINFAFFIALFQDHGADGQLVQAVELAHSKSGDEDRNNARTVLDFFEEMLN
ncbi:hypothetical protein V8E54_010909 [Elaphomyces granulatus]